MLPLKKMLKATTTLHCFKELEKMTRSVNCGECQPHCATGSMRVLTCAYLLDHVQ